MTPPAPTRHAIPAVAALAVLAACSGPAPEPAPTPPVTQPPAPIVVHVQVGEDATPEVEAWAEALRAAVTAGHGQLTLADAPEDAVVVRIDAVETGVGVSPEPEGEGEIAVMRGALVAGESAREFHLSYRGEAAPQAEALARNLRSFAAEAGH